MPKRIEVVVRVCECGSHFRNKEKPRGVDLDMAIDRSGLGFELWKLLYDTFDEGNHG